MKRTRDEKGRFCSEGKRKSVRCSNCGKEFSRYESEIGERNFCSKKCFYEGRKTREIKVQVPDTVDRAWLIGVIYGDGCVGKYERSTRGYHYCINVAVTDYGFAERAKRIMDDLYGYSRIDVKNREEHKDVYSARCLRKAGWKDLSGYQRMKKEGQLPSFEGRKKSAFLKGLYDSEGSPYLNEDEPSRSVVEFAMANKGIVKGVRQWLKDMGINFYSYSRTQKGFGRSDTWKMYGIRIQGFKNLIPFKEKIGFSIERKKNILEKIIDSKQK